MLLPVSLLALRLGEEVAAPPPPPPTVADDDDDALLPDADVDVPDADDDLDLVGDGATAAAPTRSDDANTACSAGNGINKEIFEIAMSVW